MEPMTRISLKVKRTKVDTKEKKNQDVETKVWMDSHYDSHYL